MNITIVDYNLGNIRSVLNMLGTFKNVKVKVSNNRNEILKSDKLILPGVGSYGNAMDRISKLKLNSTINEFAKTGNSILGICLGMQLLFEGSNEMGYNKGLGLISGKVEKIPSKTFKILPNIGYYKLNFKDEKLNLKYKDYWYYFVHSYHCIPTDKFYIESEIIINSTNIISSFSKDNIHGCQFHPEKSTEGGIEYFKSFLNQ
ncbi:imidazole glycerol phosphate synthase subunit HisH [Flavobacteriaceae bacterium]|nr:imidazole glycerol phosphate synthase subunit HisH [Flavobacteriaceae bacterium]